MAGGLAERKKPEHIHNPSGPRAFLLRPHYKEPSGSEGPGSGHARGRVAVRTGLPLERERTDRNVQRRVAVRNRGLGTLSGEWQCDPHCHSGVNVPGRYARGRVAVRDRGPGTLGGEWQCGRDCHSGVNVPGRYARERVAVKGRGPGTLGGEWQCGRDCHSGVNVPGRYARGRVAVLHSSELLVL